MSVFILKTHLTRRTTNVCEVHLDGYVSSSIKNDNCLKLLGGSHFGGKIGFPAGGKIFGKVKLSLSTNLIPSKSLPIDLWITEVRGTSTIDFG